MRFLTGFLLRSIVRLALLTAVVLAGITVARSATDEVTAALGADRARIVRAVDGDTLLVRIGGREERVRVLGIDTPETDKPGGAVERCGPEASARAKSWATAHRTVTLQRDPAAPGQDRYGRLLRYVQPKTGRDLSTVQVAAGLARVAAYGQDLRKLDDLRAAQRRAKKANRGLWGTSCSINR